jgi:chemotaxis protein CheZ
MRSDPHNEPLALVLDARSGATGATGARAKPARARRRKALAAPASSANDHVAVIGATDAVVPIADPAAVPMAVDAFHLRVGNLTRVLHDALRELGYDRDLAAAREDLPDARDRLAYIARVTGEAAEKVLNAVDHARRVQDELAQRAADLRSRWQAVGVYTAGAHAGRERATPAGRKLVDETCDFFASLDAQADRTQAILTDIMMAQDFHDLTGQVIRKVVALAHNMEEQLVRLLIESTPPDQRKRVEHERLAGPVVKPEGRDDVVTDQAQVDDLLASLGF